MTTTTVVLLATSRGQRPSAFATALDQLGVLDRSDVEVAVVGLHPATGPLPVTRHLVVGARAAVDGAAQELPTAGLAAARDALAPAAAPAPAAGGAATTPAPAAPPRGAVDRLRRVRRLRQLVRRVAPGTASSVYAAACLRSPAVRGLVRDATVVVALDVHTYRAAWLLARRYPGPAVVVGEGAGRRGLPPPAQD